MKNLDITAIIVGMIGVVNVNKLITMNYWDIFQLGLKVCVFLTPILILYLLSLFIKRMLK